jgi:DNA primase
VSFGSALDAKEQVRQAVDIVGLVGSYVQLRRQGRNFVGLCPWHDDSRPSLQVNPERQSFKCWVCDIGGDVFSFVMKVEGLEFREALELLAERAGIQLRPPARPASEPGGASAGPENDKRSLYRVMAWAESQFHQCLLAAREGEPGREYLAHRGISPDTAQRFHLGFAPDQWDWLLQRAQDSPWKPPVLERVGLLRRKELGGGYYDWFRGRVMFSIRDARSRCVAFGGRVLPQLAGERAAKYINSPETPLFSKSRELYGLDFARDHFKGAGGAIVMEGYTDCLMAYQHGIHNVVAVLGTALGERHLQLLRRYTDSVTLVLDGDEAGRRRTNEILDNLLALFEKNQVDLRILTLPEGVDPCDFIAQQGSDPFRQLLTRAVDALEHKFQAVTQGLDTLTDTHRASQAAEQLLGALAKIRPAGGGATSQTLLREEQMLGRIARHFHLPEEQLRNRLSALRREARRRTSAPGVVGTAKPDVTPGPGGVAESPRSTGLPPADELLLELLLSHPGYFPRIQAELVETQIESDVARRVYEAFARLAARGEIPDLPRLLAEFDDPQLKSLLVGIDEESSAKPPTEPARLLQDVLTACERRQRELRHRAALAAARQDANNAEQLLAQFCEQSKSKHRSDYQRRKK